MWIENSGMAEKRVDSWKLVWKRIKNNSKNPKPKPKKIALNIFEIVKDFISTVIKLIEINFIISSSKTKKIIEIKAQLCQKSKFWKKESIKIEKNKLKNPAEKPPIKNNNFKINARLLFDSFNLILNKFYFYFSLIFFDLFFFNYLFRSIFKEFFIA